MDGIPMKQGETKRSWARSVGAVAWLACAISVVLMLPTSSRAAEGDGEKPTRSGFVAGEVGYEGLGEDDYIGLRAKGGFQLPVPKVMCPDASECWTRLLGQFELPLRLRVVDRDPQDSGAIRDADWDEVADYLRVLRRVEYGRDGEALYGRLGELGDLDIGHGSIVGDYYNVVTADYWELGLNVTSDTPWGGGQLLVDNLANPDLIGGRAYLRPAAFFDRESEWNRVTVGLTVASDVDAPYTLDRQPNNTPVIGPARRPAVAEQRAATIGGVDLSVDAVDTETWSLTPYIDGNYHFQLGGGMHTGFDLRVEPTDDLVFEGSFEYRLLGNDYLPNYFGTLYEIDRYQYYGWDVGLPAPKQRVAATQPSGIRHGGHGVISARVFDWFDLSIGYADHQGAANSNLTAQLRVDPIERFQLGAFFYTQSFDGAQGIVDGDSMLFVGETRVQIWGPLYGKAGYSRLWELRDTGRYDVVNRWTVGVGASVGFSEDSGS